MTKITFILLLFFGINSYSQEHFPPPSTNFSVFNSRNLNIGNTLMPNRISISNDTPFEKVAVSFFWLSGSISYPNRVFIYDSLGSFESDNVANLLAGFKGDIAMTFDRSIPSNLYVAQNMDYNLYIFDNNANPKVSYDSAFVATATGKAFGSIKDIATDKLGNAYALDFDHLRIVKIVNPLNKSNALLTNFISFPANTYLQNLAINDSFICVTSSFKDSIQIYRLSTGVFLRSISTAPFKPNFLEFKKGTGNYLYSIQVGPSSRQIVAYDLRTDAIVQSYPDFGFGLRGLGVSNAGNLFASDGSKDRIVKFTRIKETGKNILTFAVDNQIDASIIDTIAKTVNIKVPATYNLSSVNARYTLSPFAKAFPISYDANLMSVDFSAANPKDYTVTAEDGSTQVWKVKLTKQAAASIENGKENQVELYPTIVKDKCTIRSVNKINAVEVSTMLGTKMNVVLDQKNENIIINTEEWNTGIYYIQVYDFRGNQSNFKIQKP